jgi:phosphatidylglycerol lysyltransferase
MKKNWIHVAGSFLSVLLFALALIILHQKLRAYHLHDIRLQMKQISGLSFWLAVLITCLDYWILTGYDVLALRYVNVPLEYRKTAFASFLGYVFGHNATVIGGSTARYRVYSEMGLSADIIARLILFTSTTFWLGFLTAGGIAFLLAPVALPSAFRLPFGSVRPVGVCFVLVVLGYWVLTAVRTKPLRIRQWELPIPTIRVSTPQILIASVEWLLAPGVLYLLLPKIAELSYARFVGFFLLAQLGGLVSSVPGGLGVFESVMLLFLSPLAPASAVFGSLLLYRLVYYLLPFGLGSFLLLSHEILAEKEWLRKWGRTLAQWSSVLIPYFLAFGCMIAGGLLLFSGAIPAEHERMSWLRSFLPLPAVEISHFLGSVAGAGLLILGRGLVRRLDAAYYLSLLLLAFGILFSLLKGFDYEEAVILSLMLIVFVPCRKKFYRKASLLTERFTAGWIILVILIISCSIWLGLFAYKHVDYSGELWWHFAFEADAPRFLRATSGAAILLLLFGMVRLLVPRSPLSPEVVSEVSEEIETILRASDRTYSNLVWLQDKELLFNRPRNAFLMYAPQGRSRITMGDPIGPESQWEELVWAFRELCHGQACWPVFYQVSHAHLEVYLELGMSFMKLGEEARVDLASFHLEGGERRDLRYTVNKLTKENCRFSILPPTEVAGVMEELKTVSEAWLREKNTREKRFSIGWFKPDYLMRFPIAVIRQEGRLIAFANVWETAGKEELSVDLMRHLPEAPNGVMDYLFTEMMLWGHQQGYGWFNLGMAPLSGIEDRALAPLRSRAGAFMFRYGEHFYNFQGLRRYKEKFLPVWEPKYLACPGGFMLPVILTNLTTLISGGLKGILTR